MKNITPKKSKQITFTKDFKYTVIVVDNRKLKVPEVIVTDNWKRHFKK